MSRIAYLPLATSSAAYIYRDDVYTLAKDFISGYRGDYAFFQVNSGSYCLVYDMTDFDLSSGHLTAASASVYQIDITNGSPRDVYQVSGQSGMGSASLSVIQQTVAYGWSYSADNIDILTGDYVLYCSRSGFPHLVEGRDMYAFAEILLIASCAVFVLCDQLFRRVSR